MLVVGPEDVEGWFGQSSTSTSESHNISTLCRRNLRGDQADNLIKLEGTMHGRHFEGSRDTEALFCSTISSWNFDRWQYLGRKAYLLKVSALCRVTVTEV